MANLQRGRQFLFAAAWCLIIALTAIKAGIWQPHVPGPPYTKGEKAPSVRGVDFAESVKTVLLYVRSDCRFCAESMEFYKRLSAIEAASSQRVQLVIISRDSDTVLADYLRSNGLDDERTIAGVHADFSRVPGTPTLLVVGQTGVIELVAFGRQDSSGERAILDTLTL
jgi:hypothetical protein